MNLSSVIEPQVSAGGGLEEVELVENIAADGEGDDQVKELVGHHILHPGADF